MDMVRPSLKAKLEQANPLRRYELRREETLGISLGNSIDPIPSRKSSLLEVGVTVP